LRGTVSYTAIALNGRVTTASSAAGIPIGNKVTLSATTGLTGIVAEATYYMYSCDSNGFNIAASYADALLGTPITPATEHRLTELELQLIVGISAELLLQLLEKKIKLIPMQLQ
jgi:hypothetical protein